MPILFLIRHGDNDFVRQARLPGRLPGVHLNEHGNEQAASLADSLKRFPIHAVYSSPLERALETATPIAQALGLPIQIRTHLQDPDVGEWEGMHIKQLKKDPLWTQIRQKPSGTGFPSGETFTAAQERLVREIASINQAHRQREMIALVFHSDPIKLVIAHFLGLPLDNFHRLVISTGSVSVLITTKAGGKLAALNWQPSIEPFQWIK